MLRAPHIAAVAAALALASPAHAAGKGGGKAGDGGGKAGAIGAQGQVELGLRGLHDLNPSEPTTVYLDVTLGYFFMSGFEIGLTALQGTTPSGQRDTYGVFFEYDLRTGSTLVPFAGVALKHAAPPRGTDTRNGRILAASLGTNLVVASNVALALTFQSQLADHAVLGPEGDRKRRDDGVTLGWRIFF